MNSADQKILVGQIWLKGDTETVVVTRAPSDIVDAVNFYSLTRDFASFCYSEEFLASYTLSFDLFTVQGELEEARHTIQALKAEAESQV